MSVFVCFCFTPYTGAAKVDILLKGKLIQSCGTCAKAASMISVVGKFQQTHTYTQYLPAYTIQWLCMAKLQQCQNCWNAFSIHFNISRIQPKSAVCLCVYIHIVWDRVKRNWHANFCNIYLHVSYGTRTCFASYTSCRKVLFWRCLQHHNHEKVCGLFKAGEIPSTMAVALVNFQFVSKFKRKVVVCADFFLMPVPDLHCAILKVFIKKMQKCKRVKC